MCAGCGWPTTTQTLTHFGLARGAFARGMQTPQPSLLLQKAAEEARGKGKGKGGGQAPLPPPRDPIAALPEDPDVH